MLYFSIARCPYLKIDVAGALCESEGRLIKDIEHANIKFCLCRNYERCGIYHISLGEVIRNSDAGVVAAI